MKRFVLISVILAVFAAGCSQFQMSAGIGYRKCPPGFEKPILYPEFQKVAEATMKAKGLSDGQVSDILTSYTLKGAVKAEDPVLKGINPEIIEWIIGFLTGETIGYFLPANNRVDVGVYGEIIAKK